METNSVKSILFSLTIRGQTSSQIRLPAATAVFVGLDKGPEELPLSGNLEVKGLVPLTLCAGSQLNELWLLKKPSLYLSERVLLKKVLSDRVLDYFQDTPSYRSAHD